MSAKIRLANCDPADLGIVPAGKVIIFLDSNDNKLRLKKDDQLIYELEDTDVLVSVSANDTTPGYLEDKIGAGLGIQLNTLNDGANEVLQVIADVQTVFGRTGNVVAEAGDYSAVQITFDDTAAGVNGANLQAAVDDLGARLLSVENALSSHFDGGPSKHDASEIDYERNDANKTDIAASSDSVDLALDNLDDQKLSRTGSQAMLGDLDMGANNITNVGLVDGRDVSVDGAKLDGIEAGATADQIASEVPVTPTGNLTSNQAQAAFEELQGDIDAINAETYVNTFNGRTGDVVQDIFQATQQTAQNNITAPVAVSFDAPNQNVPSTYNYNSTTGILVINKVGKFRFNVMLTADTANGARQTSLTRLQRFNGAVFVDIPVAEGQSRAYGYHRNNASGETTAVIQTVLDVTAGQQFRVMTQSTTAGPINTIPLGSSFLVEEI